MFRGSDPINMDAKGRMAIPTRYRALLENICSNDLVITIDMKSTCLTLSPLPEWKKFEEKVAALPAMDELGEMLSRFVVGQAKDLQVDASGRILIPTELRGYAELEKKLQQRHGKLTTNVVDWVDDSIGHLPCLSISDRCAVTF